MPTSSDLVTDLPADFETFGQAVDTSLADLKGGTTGQVLSKASNTDMDFTWVAADDTNAIQNAIVDAKGDLIAASAADTPARLAVGNNGETLVADSSTSTGLRYQAPVNANPILNSSFQVWQRGTSIAGSAGSYLYTADRWQTNASTALTVSRQATGDTTNLPFIQYCARVQRNNASTATAAAVLSQSFETINSIPYAGRTVTLSFYARRGANFSGASNQLEVYLASGTGTDQNAFVGGFTGAANVIYQTPTLTTTWQRFSYTATVGTSATQLATQFTYTPTGTAGAADFYEVTGVQLEIGSVATPFKTYAGTLQGELSAAQRYYYRATPATNYSNLAIGQAISTTGAMLQTKLPTTMRTRPTAIEYGGTIQIFDGVTATNITTLAINNDLVTTTDIANIRANVSSGLTQYRPYQLSTVTDATAYIGFSAEL